MTAYASRHHQRSAPCVQAIAAARAIAARLAGGGGAEASPQAVPPPPQADSMPGVGGRRPPFNPPPGLGASASYYPDLSRDRSDRDRGQDASRARPDAGGINPKP